MSPIRDEDKIGAIRHRTTLGWAAEGEAYAVSQRHSPRTILSNRARLGGQARMRKTAFSAPGVWRNCQANRSKRIVFTVHLVHTQLFNFSGKSGNSISPMFSLRS